ncbi:hypothetical protein AYO38_01685 [bacterium SCGC AG-212-C10]|nr:hypothetical protein AYO38_01685 [bacterium SCGC AG-212-C10]
MSNKRGEGVQPPKRPRTIVRRSADTVGRSEPVIGAPPRHIIKRRNGGGVTAPPPPPEPREHRRHWWRPGRKLVIAMSAFGGFAMVAALALWVWTSPFFQVQEITVAGNERVSSEAVIERAGLVGESLFSADLASAQKQIYGLPLVASVRIEREWPHTVKVTIQERQAWGTWQQSGVDYTIDRDGVVLGTLAPPPDAPVIKSSEPGSRQQGDRVDYQAIDAAAAIYEKLPEVLGTTVAEVSYVAGKGLVVTTDNGQTALFGDSSSISYKLAVWSAIAKEASAEHMNYTTIDLRYGNRPVLQ